MKVSIITVYYNRENEVIDSIESLLNQTYKEIEVIAIDDGSTDDTLKKLNQFDDNRLKVFTHDNIGFVKSIVKGIELSSGSVIAIHGSGDISYKDRIKKQLELLNSYEEIGLVSCDVENYFIAEKKSKIHNPKIRNGEDLSSRLLKKNLFTHGEVMFKKDIYDKVGGYRTFFKYSQDQDLWLRMSLSTKFGKVNEVLYKRYRFEDGVSTSINKLFLQTLYSEFSRQCFNKRIKDGHDYLDVYGNSALVFFNGRKSDKRFMYLFLSRFIDENLNDALFAITKAREISKTTYNTALYIMIKLSVKNKIMYKFFKYVFTIVKKLKDKKHSVQLS